VAVVDGSLSVDLGIEMACDAAAVAEVEVEAGEEEEEEEEECSLECEGTSMGREEEEPRENRGEAIEERLALPSCRVTSGGVRPSALLLAVFSGVSMCREEEGGLEGDELALREEELLVRLRCNSLCRCSSSFDRPSMFRNALYAESLSFCSPSFFCLAPPPEEEEKELSVFRAGRGPPRDWDPRVIESNRSSSLSSPSDDIF
jgi:hypothetical protein